MACPPGTGLPLKRGHLFRPDGSRIFMADGKLITMREMVAEANKKPDVGALQDSPERLGSILLSNEMCVPSRWSPIRARREQLRATSPMRYTDGSYCNIEDAGAKADPWPLVNNDKVSNELNISKRFNRFVESGLKSKSAINIPVAEEVTERKFQDFYMTGMKRLEQTKRLQKSCYYENTCVNKLNPKPLRQFGPQDRPHHIPKKRTIKHAFP